MSTFSDPELEALLGDLESDRIERKQSFRGDAPQKVREAVCAFANDLVGHAKPGVVLIGVHDNGLPTPGFKVTDELLRSLADIKADGNIVPPPMLLVEKRLLCGGEVAVITVWPCDTPPARYKGRIHVRWGPRRGLASAQDERILNERRRYRDRPFDVQPVRSAKLSHLSRVHFEHDYLPALVAPDVLAANDRTYEQKLAATKLIVDEADPIPTVLGVLTLNAKPSDFIGGAWGQFLRIDGVDLASPILDEETVTGSVKEQVRRIEEKLAAHNLRTVRFIDVPIEQRHEAFPLDALHQLVRNAYLHRSYETTHAPVRVYWFNDRIEVSSPGGAFGSVTPENFGQPGLTDYRNPNLAEAMRAQGLIQRFGFGITFARKSLGARLKFDVQPGFVTAIVRAEDSVRDQTR
jgi:ATP-dependent DNA helicase RecG